MTFGERLTQLRKEHGYTTRKSFAQKLNIPETTLRNYETDEREAGHTFLKQMADFFDVSCDYLLGLTDDKEKTESYRLKKSEYERIVKYKFISEHSPDGAVTIDTVLDREYSIAGQLKEQKEYIRDLERTTSHDDIHNSKIRLINYYYRLASAGTGQIVFDTPPTKRIEIPDLLEYRKVDYAIGVNGSSMEPVFHDGDTLLIEMTDKIEVDEIGIFLVDNESYVKKLGKGELVSLNPEYDNIKLTADSKCMGKVIDKL
ncbi:MAG: XRE family transcriptional regulator [Clostridium sp.]|nr:XRE family transcriptional regulator [Clostridium sp.]